ncbi:MAG: nitroreductase family protein [Actinomycetota bacterium]
MRTEKKAQYGKTGESLMTYNLIAARRTIRKFLQKDIDKKILQKLVNAARLAPSAANLQPLEFVVVDDRKLVSELFPLTSWAGYIKPEGTPGKGEEPVAFIAFVINQRIATEYSKVDSGAAAQNLILAALEEGIGSCIIAACDKKKIGRLINIPDDRRVEFVIALGYPAEKPMAEEAESGSIKYYKDGRGILHVPKRPLEEILYFNRY